MKDSLVSLEVQPWRFLIELFKYLIWGTGLLFTPVVQVAVFSHSLLLDKTGRPTKTSEAFTRGLPDIEIIPVRVTAQRIASI